MDLHFVKFFWFMEVLRIFYNGAYKSGATFKVVIPLPALSTAIVKSQNQQRNPENYWHISLVYSGFCIRGAITFASFLCLVVSMYKFFWYQFLPVLLHRLTSLSGFFIAAVAFRNLRAFNFTFAFCLFLFLLAGVSWYICEVDCVTVTFNREKIICPRLSSFCHERLNVVLGPSLATLSN